jgi:uncharacterized protein
MDVFEVLRDVAGDVFAAQPVTFAYLYGSRARSDARPDSDIDVAVHVDDAVESSAYLRLSLQVGGELSHRAGIGPINGVVILNEAPLRLIGRILADRRVIYSRDEVARVRFEVQMHARALDFELHAAALDQQLLRLMAAGDR